MICGEPGFSSCVAFGLARKIGAVLLANKRYPIDARAVLITLAAWSEAIYAALAIVRSLSCACRKAEA